MLPIVLLELLKPLLDKLEPFAMMEEGGVQKAIGGRTGRAR